MGGSVVAQQLAAFDGAADQEIPVSFKPAHVSPIAEAGRAEQRAAPVRGAAIDAPGQEQDRAGQQERNVGGNLAIAEDALEPAMAGEQHDCGDEHREQRADPPAGHQATRSSGVIANPGSASG